MQYLVLARKYRPKTFSDVVGQPHVVQALSNALTQNKIHHAYLFTGTRGIGKTTLARIFAKSLNCERGVSSTPCNMCNSCQEIDEGRHPDFYEVDAASRTKVEDTRELLDNVQYACSKGRFKIYLIDEVHMLSGHSFNALLKTLEEPPEHIKFLLATTDPQKLPATILSRCLQFHLNHITNEKIRDHLASVLQKENINFDDAALTLISVAANGSIRDALSLLDQCIAFGNGSVLTADVKTMLGSIEPTSLFEILHALASRNGEKVLDCINKLNSKGTDFYRALNDLLAILHKISMLQVVTNAPIEENKEELLALTETLQPPDVQLFYQIGIIGLRDFKFAPSPKIGFEMTLLRMLAFYPNNKEMESMPLKPSTKRVQTPEKIAPVQPKSEWQSMLSALNLTGAALALAKNCNLEKITDTHVYLTVSIRQKPLIQPKQTARINEALNKYLNRKITLKIHLITSSQQSSPTATQVQDTTIKSTSTKAFSQDPTVKQLIETFDATFVENPTATHDENL